MPKDKKLCDNCKKNPPEYTSGSTQLCRECAEDVGWLEVLEDQY
jgi:hypothetical protein